MGILSTYITIRINTMTTIFWNNKEIIASILSISHQKNLHHLATEFLGIPQPYNYYSHHAYSHNMADLNTFVYRMLTITLEYEDRLEERRI